MKSLGPLCALVLCACGSRCPEPFYEGQATDEAWRTMQDAEPRAKADAAKAVTLVFPLEGDRVSAAGGAPIFSWTTPLVAALDAPRPTPRPGGAASLRAFAERWVYSSAWAHLPPVTGPIHLLRMTVPGRACPLEVLTTRTEWLPNTAAWTELKTFTSGTASLDVFSAYLTQNRVTEGPYHLTRPLSFTVTK